MRPARILLVSRDIDFISIYGVALRHFGYDVLVADAPLDDPAETLRAVAHRVDAALVELPTTARHCDLAAQLRRAARRDTLPVIALTARVLPDELAAARRCGCTRVLPMPVPLCTVLDEIARAVQVSARTL